MRKQIWMTVLGLNKNDYYWGNQHCTYKIIITIVNTFDKHTTDCVVFVEFYIHYLLQVILMGHNSSKYNGDVVLIIITYLAKICALICGVQYSEEIRNST